MRRLAFVSIAVLCVAAGSSPTRVGPAAHAQTRGPAAASDSWPQFRGRPDLSGVATTSIPDTLKPLWTFEGGESIESSPAIVDGTVYVGAQSGDLFAVDLASGKLRWKYAAGNPIGESSPAVSSGRVYVGDLGGLLHAVDAATGKRVWTFKTGTEIKSSPVVVGDIVVIGSYDGLLYGVRAKTGEAAWNVRFDGYVHGTPAVADGVAYVTGCDETFRAIRVADGKELFSISTGAYTGASPAIVDGAAFFGTFENQVLRIDLKGRKITWRYEHPERHFPFYASPAVTAGKVVVGGRDKMVHGLDAATGKAVWTFATNARVESSPAVASGRVYVGSNDGRFYVLDLASGKKVWEFTAGAPISSSPALAARRVVVGTQDGRLVCFG